MRMIILAATLGLTAVAGLALAQDEGPAPKPAADAPAVKKAVLVELFTSQG